MIIHFLPQRRNDTLTIFKEDDILTINGQVLDFSEIPDGSTIPAEIIPCAFIVDDVHRENGDLVLTVILPHGANPSQEVAFPSSVIDPPDGVIQLPTQE